MTAMCYIVLIIDGGNKNLMKFPSSWKENCAKIKSQ